MRYEKDGIVIRLPVSRRRLAACLALAVLAGTAIHLSSETLIFNAAYPSPAGIYQALTVTGEALLARDRGLAGNVGIRLGAGVLPLSPLDIGSQNAGTEGAEIRFRGAGANRYFYLDNFSGNLRMVSQDAVGESVKFQVTNAGDAWVKGNVSVKGNAAVAGNVSVTGDVTANRVHNATYAP